MVATITKTSEFEWVDTIEINTLDELKKFQQECGSEIIISFGSDNDSIGIEIYDGYRE